MHIFVTGATGYIGSAVAFALQQQGHNVAGLARSEAAVDALDQTGIKAARGDLAEPDTLVAPAFQADAVIHTASTMDARMAALDPPAVETMLDALAGTGKPFLYTSGTFVIGDTGETLASEADVPRPAPHVAWRLDVENTVRAAQERGVRSIVLRPGRVYGHGGSFAGRLVAEARAAGTVRFIGDGQNHWSVVHLDDLADLYLLALEKAPPGTLLNAVAEPAVRMKDIAEAASRAGGANGHTTSITLEEARAAFGPAADALAMNQEISNAAARRLGWNPKAPSVLEDLAAPAHIPA